MTTTHVHNVTTTPRVSHYPDLARPFVTIAAYDAEGSDVAMFFIPGDNMSELDRAEAWLRDALDRVQVAKIAHANAQQEPLPLLQVGTEGEPLDLTENPLITGCQATSSSAFRCSLSAGHYGDHINSTANFAWRNNMQVTS